METEALDATVSARIPEVMDQAIESHVKELRESGMRVTEADIVRISLTEFFKKRKIKITKRNAANGKADA